MDHGRWTLDGSVHTMAGDDASHSGRSTSLLPQELVSRIVEAIRSVRYGTVRITIHNSQVVQIEKAEKIRVDTGADLNAGGDEEQPSRADQMTGRVRPSEGGRDG